MKISHYIFAVLIASTLMATPAIASDKPLQQQVDALTERLSELEQRLISIEKRPTTVTRTTIIKTDNSLPPPTNPGEWQDTTNWIHLKVGMDYQDVRDLLGEPLKIRRGASEFWYYTDKKFGGPHLKFLFKKVNAWTAPEGIAGTD
ncbi:MAG: outer membrane protein assembly factor BamE [Gammaproteobacteria bacterium]|nr:outer membrane protein assembly factor BamE [Gammaproteobacteria bacterium]